MARVDVIIIGSGIGGSALALILKAQGLDVLLLDKARHPRFALGEAGIKETSLTFAILGRRFGVPELLSLSEAARVRRDIGSGSGQKQSFTFLWHGPGAPFDPRHTCQVGSPAFPFGTDTHYHRAEVDAWLARAAVARGIPLIEGADIAEIAPGPDAVRLRLTDGRTFTAPLLVDGPGICPPSPHALSRRVSPPARPPAPPPASPYRSPPRSPPASPSPPLRTQSYALFTHARGLAPVEDALPELKGAGLPQRPSRGTTHHLFPGGWAWVIPFDNLPGGTSPLTSVGICLDPRVHPRGDAPPSEAFKAAIANFPALRRHLGSLDLARPIAATGPLQRREDALPAPGVVRPPHGVGFVDPLFSRGLYLLGRGTERLAEGILAYLAGDTRPTAGLEAYARWMDDALDVTDRLVASAYAAFASFELFDPWHRVWGLGAYLESLRVAGRALKGLGGALPTAEGPSLPLDLPAYGALFAAAEAALIHGVGPGAPPPEETGARLFDLLRQSPALPAPLAYDDPGTRALAARALRHQIALRRWARRPGTPAEVAALFDYPLGAVPALLWERWGRPPRG